MESKWCDEKMVTSTPLCVCRAHSRDEVPRMTARRRWEGVFPVNAAFFGLPPVGRRVAVALTPGVRVMPIDTYLS